MIEKVITLEGFSPVDILGVANLNLNEISSAFPDAQIVSRGNEIRIKGKGHEILRINDLINMLINHHKKYGKITIEVVKDYLSENQPVFTDLKNDAVLFGTKGITIKARTENQKTLVDTVKKNDLVFALGPAGTGKTYISVAMAVKALKNKEVKKIIITRPAVEAGENLGFLPGDLQEKLDPYLRPIYDALHDMIPAEKLKIFQENNIIEIAPLAYMRGRTLKDAFILLDEAQNTTPMQIKMFLTRMGQNSKVIITGDESQVDLPLKQKSGLKESLKILEGISGIGVVRLQASDVIRHKLVKHIIRAYDQFEDQQKTRS
ncbi:PhoH family protein [Persicobacter psychrovividus]|uniref:PhoH-like protein n=1 Tax=Persicobacter psychrovividus TaxID=387638 RepID=A0ABN6L6S1_9BACT|nr:phosphate starvation protein PhoH [Persicobacter psychrovividus]